MNQNEKILFQEYSSIKNGEKSANALGKLIKNNEGLNNWILDKSIKLIEKYGDVKYTQMLYYVFSNNTIEYCFCGEPKKWRNLTKGYNKTCGKRECVSRENNTSIKEHYLNKFGVEHLFMTKTFKDNLKNKFMSKYGVDNPWKSEEIKQKIKNKNLELYGETSWMKIEENSKKTALILSQKKFDDKIKKIDDYNIPIIIKNRDQKIITIECKICNEVTEASMSFINKKIAAKQNPCFTCNPVNYSVSSYENELFEYVKSIYAGNIVRNDRKLLSGKEIDLLLPDSKIAFEFDGTYWHSEIFKEKDHAIAKKKIINNLGIKLYNIKEDNWVYKKEITKARIKNALGLSKKIPARKCDLKIVTSKEEREFLEKNHIQGYVPSKIKIGLYYKDSLISIMTFGKKRLVTNSMDNTDSYELLRFCSEINHNIQGGASRLFNYFTKNYNPEHILSYQDNSWHTGNLYEKLGFILKGITKQDYYWCRGNIRYHRFNYRKDKLVAEGEDQNKTESQIMTERGYYKSWGQGSLIWIYKNPLK